MTGYCAKRDDAFKILPIGHYCLAFNAASLTALLIDLLIDVVPSCIPLSLCSPTVTVAAPPRQQMTENHHKARHGKE